MLLLSTFPLWFFIEVGLKGCCGARQTGESDSLAILLEIAASITVGLLIYGLLRWGWNQKLALWISIGCLAAIASVYIFLSSANSY